MRQPWLIPSNPRATAGAKPLPSQIPVLLLKGEETRGFPFARRPVLQPLG